MSVNLKKRLARFLYKLFRKRKKSKHKEAITIYCRPYNTTWIEWLDNSSMHDSVCDSLSDSVTEELNPFVYIF